MMVATQRMTDKYRVTSVLIELAIGFNHQVETRECLPAPQGQASSKWMHFGDTSPTESVLSSSGMIKIHGQEQVS